jgi:thioesterase domain-containing protein
MWINMTIEQLESYILNNVPLTKHMGVKVTQCSVEKLELSAPLDKNSNHVGTGFGGSLGAMQALCCWAWLTNFLDENKIEATVVLQESASKFKKPVTENIVASCFSPDKQIIKQFLSSFTKKKKARIELNSVICSHGQPAIIYEGKYVALEAHNF